MCVQGLGRRGGLGGLPTPYVVLCAEGMSSIVLLFLVLQKWQLGFSVSFCVIQNLPPAAQRCVSGCPHCSTAAKGAWPASRRPLPARLMPRSVHLACFPRSPSRSPRFLVAPRLTSLMWVLISSWAHPEAPAILPLMLVFLPGTLLELDATDFSEGEPSAPSPLALWLGNPHQALRPV